MLESWCFHVKEGTWGGLGKCIVLTFYMWELTVYCKVQS